MPFDVDLEDHAYGNTHLALYLLVLYKGVSRLRQDMMPTVQHA